MQYKIAIEETVVDEFEVEASSDAEAIRIAGEKYHKGEFVLEPGEVQFKQMAIISPEREQPDWVEF